MRREEPGTGVYHSAGVKVGGDIGHAFGEGVAGSPGSAVVGTAFTGIGAVAGTVADSVDRQPASPPDF
jgi:hypothetical protein